LNIEIIYIIGAVQGLFFSGLVMNKRAKSLGDYVMIAWFIILSIMLLAYSLEVMGIEDQYPIFWSLNTSLPVLVGPIALLYVLAYTRKDQKIHPLFSLHSIPYLVFTAIVCIKMFVNSEGTVRENINYIEDVKAPEFFLLEQARIFLGPVYLIFSLFILRKHGERISHYFSFTEDIDLKWIRNVILMLVLVWITVIIVNIISNWNEFIPWRLGDNIIYLMVTFTVFANGYYGIKQQIIFSPASVSDSQNNHQPQKKSQYLKSGLSNKESKKQLAALLKYMEEEKPYLDGKLSLAQVAEDLNISTNHLSQVINSELNKNFFDFINGYRVNLVKQKMSDESNKHLTLLGMAFESGFNSKSSFNSIFKKYTGSTPSEFMRSKRT
jgi:AraC-like DNA-binding protein